jgi:hypothetical protein
MLVVGFFRVFFRRIFGVLRKKLSPVPSSLHMSNEGKKKQLLVPPLPLKGKKNLKIKKSRRTPSPRKMNKYNKIIPLAPLNSKK